MLKLKVGGGVFMRWLWLSVLAAVLAAMAAVPAMAQLVAPSKSGMVSYIEGEVRIDDQLIPDPIVATFPYMRRLVKATQANPPAEFGSTVGS